MKIKYTFILFFVYFFIYSNSAYSFSDTLIVKFKGKPEAVDLSGYLSKYNLKRLIRPALTNLNNLPLSIKLNSTELQLQMNELAQIYLLIYDSNILKNKLINTLNQTGFFNYVEQVPERHLFFIPNDTLFSAQYYMGVMKVTDAWDSIKVKSKIIVGVVDTGVDYTHPDLAENIYINPGETGFDNNGNDKRSNGIDDDENGFIDDWHGWDFTADSLGEDNDPFPGHGHGTHVSGTIGAVINNITGIAGMCDSIKILPCKTAGDSPFSTSLIHTYEAILYAAKMGASVINCSWGGTSRSEAEQEVINTVVKMGTSVIAAAGNDNQDTPFFPAGYDGVISVSATDSSDTKTFFSNYNSSVDVSAPGINIISTTPYNTYSTWMGTSMASPIASGVAAMIKMVHPEYSALQVEEHLKATTDDINAQNPDYIGKLGTGRVNALKAVTEKNPKSIRVKKILVQNENQSDVFLNGQKCFISLSLENILSELSDFKIFVRAVGNSDVTFSPSKTNYGIFKQYQEIILDKKIEFILPEISENDFKFELEFSFLDGDKLINQALYSFFVNPTYLTFENNFIKTTINSHGNIGYNDYPKNEQGVGFTYNGSSNLLFEGSLMISSDSLLADVARTGNQSMQNMGLSMHDKIKYLPLESPVLLEGKTSFADNPLISSPVGIKVNQTIYQSKTLENTIFSIYDIINQRSAVQDSVYLGLYFDWDIGISGTDNLTYWDKENQCGIVYNTKVDSLPKIAIKMLSNQKNNFWAIDNDGTTYENPGVWDGFTELEKMRMLKSGIGRDSSNITDVSNVISAGPIFLSKGDTARVCFAITSDNSLINLIASIKKATDFGNEAQLSNGNYNLPVENSDIFNIFPNPVKSGGNISIELQLNKQIDISMDIYDYLGRKVVNVLNNTYNSGKYIINNKLENLSIGTYFIRIKMGNSFSTGILIVY